MGNQDIMLGKAFVNMTLSGSFLVLKHSAGGDNIKNRHFPAFRKCPCLNNKQVVFSSTHAQQIGISKTPDTLF